MGVLQLRGPMFEGFGVLQLRGPMFKGFGVLQLRGPMFKEGRPMSSRTLHSDTTAEVYLELLKDRGIDVFLGNAGTDFASLVEAFARFESEGGRAPRTMVVPHELVAV